MRSKVDARKRASYEEFAPVRVVLFDRKGEEDSPPPLDLKRLAEEGMDRAKTIPVPPTPTLA